MSRVTAPLVAFVRTCLRRHVRGSTRVTFLLARHLRSLQAVPITVNRTQRLFVDLRDGLSHDLLAGSPWENVPWEPDEQIVMRRLVRPNDVIFDVGAHIGLHMVLLSELAGPGGVVHAFEANPAKLGALEATAREWPNTVIHAVALSDRDARDTLFVPEDQTMASLRNWTEGRVGAVKPAECQLKPVDALVAAGTLPQPDFIKCDVEGAELQVFSGAARTLDREDAPVILYEANGRSANAFGLPISAATDFLRALRIPGYFFFHVQEGGRLVPIDRFTPDIDHYNLVAVPRARADRLQ